MPLFDYAGTAGIFTGPEAFSPGCIDHYREEGWVLLKGFLDPARDVAPVHREVNELIRIKLRQLGLPDAAGPVSGIDTGGFLAVCRADREKGGEIYRTCRHLLSLHRLLVRQDNIRLVSQFMGTDLVNVLPYTALRIDIRGEEKYLFEWHQDYPYTQGSPDGVIVWIPLVDVRKADGGVKLIPRSHRSGIAPLRFLDPGNASRNGAHTVEIIDADRFDREDSYRVDVEIGDALVFNTLLIHKSLPMERGEVRWTTQLRYANFRHPDAIARAWPPGMLEGGDLERLHPEAVSR